VCCSVRKSPANAAAPNASDTIEEKEPVQRTIEKMSPVYQFAADFPVVGLWESRASVLSGGMLTLWMEADQKRPAAPHFPPPAREHLLSTSSIHYAHWTDACSQPPPSRACKTLQINNEDQPNVMHIDDGIDIPFLGMRLLCHGSYPSRMSRQLPTSCTLQTTPSASHRCANERHVVIRPDDKTRAKQ
jgi:hypothetical protein